MIPLRDNIPSRRFPLVNVLLILVNAALFFYELSLPPRELHAFLVEYGMVPARYASLERLAVSDLFPFLSSMFLHGGWLHVIANLWILWIFGDNVEDAMGRPRYLVFYLLCGLGANLAQLWASWGSTVPTIGASGAIAGVMGAYFVLYPGARVLCLVPIFVVLYKMELPAAVFLGLWMWSQLYSGALALSGSQGAGGIAWWAHIGGFVAGVMLLGIFLGGRRRRSYR